MFNGLDNVIQFSGETINIQNLIRWSIGYLAKDDRIIWYLSVVRRYFYHCMLQKADDLSPKLQKKIIKKVIRKI